MGNLTPWAGILNTFMNVYSEDKATVNAVLIAGVCVCRCLLSTNVSNVNDWDFLRVWKINGSSSFSAPASCISNPSICRELTSQNPDLE